MVVMIVEDDDLIRDTIVSYFEHSGIDVMAQETADGALAKLNSGPTVEILITDIMLPGMTGFELIQHIRRSDSINELPIIVISGLGTPEAKKRAEELNVHEYLVKPLDLEDVHRSIEKIKGS